MATPTQNEWVERVLLVRPAGSGPSEPSPSLIGFAKARLEWQAAKAAVAMKLDTLNKAIAQNAGPDAAQLLATGTAALARILARFDEGLADTLDALVNASGTQEAAALRRKAGDIVTRYTEYVQNDELIAYVETNPTGSLGIAATLGPPLDAIRKQLGAR